MREGQKTKRLPGNTEAAFFRELPQDQGLVDGMDLTREMHPLLTKWRRGYPEGLWPAPGNQMLQCLMEGD